MKEDITELFLFLDDFCTAVDEHTKKHTIALNESQCADRKPTRKTQLSNSEILTIVLLYHRSPCKNFKFFYDSYLWLYKRDFPRLVSYERLVELKQRVLIYLMMLLTWFMHQARQTGISYVDATSINVCHGKRIRRNKVFKGLAEIGKTTKGWFFGFKLHVVINEQGEIYSVALTPGNVDDRAPVPCLTKRLSGLIFGDKGYISSELFKELHDRGLKLITGIKKNMKNVLMSSYEKIMLRKRSIIETVFSYFKGTLELEHSRHRSVANFLVHILGVLVSYSFLPTKPSITQEKHEYYILSLLP